MDDGEFLASFETQLSEQTDDVEESQENTTNDPIDNEDQEDIGNTQDQEEEEEISGSEEEYENEESEEPEEEPEDIDYQGFYSSVMKPFKANGKEIEIKNPDEAVQLMKMGANYTKKMQEISKHRKTLATLQEHGIESIEDITFLIDLKNKNPEAIKKFFKDNEIDPFDIDTSTEVDYKPQARVVNEVDINAREILEELKSSKNGLDTINYIADNWDNESTAFMWENPEAFNIIHEQRESGVFNKIIEEVERQTTLGILPHGGSILEKYYQVGNQMFGRSGQPNGSNTRRPIDTRVASRSSAQSSNNRAKAAGSPRASKRTSMVLEDMLGLDDAAFLKAMENKL